MARLIRKGGKGSGNFGHAGRPGKVGGSAPQSVGSVETGDVATSHETKAATEYARMTGETVSDAVAAASKKYHDMLKRFWDEHDDSVGDGFLPYPDFVMEKIIELSGMPRKAVMQMFEAWRTDSNNAGASWLQRAIVDSMGDKFGTHLSEWQKTLYAKYEDTVFDRDAWAEVPVQKFIDDDKVIAAAIYESTQEFLKKNGIDGLYLFRGMKLPADNVPDDFQVGSSVEVDTNALESFTIAPSTAFRFVPRVKRTDDGGYAVRNLPSYEGYKGVIVGAWVPRERIFSMPLTGIGVAGEGELVVMNSGGNDKFDVAAIIDPSTPQSGVSVTDYAKKALDKKLDKDTEPWQS